MVHRMKEILEHKWNEILELKQRGLPAGGGEDMSPRRDFKAAISRPGRLCLIAEIKFASPSAGLIRERSDPCALGRVYQEAGAAAISFLTDQRFFGGRLEELPLLKKSVTLPVLRKDFILDSIQVRESLVYGADAILLIARILSGNQLRELLGLSRELGLDPLTEVHDIDDLEKALECGAEIIGINNRDLDTFEVHLETTFDLIHRIPRQCVIVSESGISTPENLQRLRGSGIQAVLVGTSIMRSGDMGGKIRELISAGDREKEG